MQNDQGQVVDLYVPRKCSATNRLIIAKDHASVQINVAEVDESGKMTGSNVTYAFSGGLRETGDSDDSLNRLAQQDGRTSLTPLPACSTCLPSFPTFLPPPSTSPSADSCLSGAVFIIVSASLFLPVVLESYARSNGRLGPAYVEKCPASGGGTEEGGEEGAGRCAVKLLGGWVDTASFSLMVYSASVALQALTVISMGKLADSPTTRHRLLTLFALTGSLLCICFLFLPETSPVWPLCAVLAVGANVSFGASIVCLNSYLPDLARGSPSVLSARHALLTARRSPSSPSLPSSSSPSSPSLADLESQYTSALALSTSSLSSRAIAAGYAAGIGALLALLPVVRALGKMSGGEGGEGGEGGGAGGGGTWAMRVAIAASGGWWLLGSVPATIWLRHPPSLYSPSPLAPAREQQEGEDQPTFVETVKEGWRGLGRMLGEWRALPQTFVFLAAWFVLSDSYATITSTAMLFAKTTLNLPTSSLVLVAILSPTSGIAGALLFPVLQKRGFSHLNKTSASSPVTLSNHSMLLLLVLLTLLVPLWGLVSLTSSLELYALAVLFGALYGSFQSYARTVFSALIPTKQSARWFALYSVTDKSSSFVGPLCVSILTEVSGEIRHGFYIILAFLLLSLPILVKVDMEKGSKAAEEYEARLKAGGEGEEGEGEGEGEGLLRQRDEEG
ncbi:hypothetical protein JCM8547_001794 [Rhodosporidiobolus lusitaniae]